MSALPEAGAAGRPFEMPIEIGKVREFALATKARHPSYAVSGLADALSVPPTFLTTAAWWTTPGSAVLASLDDQWSRLLHGSQRYVFHGPPPRSGERLVATQRVRNVSERTGRRAGPMTFIDWSTDFTAPDGTLRAEELHLTILTSQPPSPAGEGGVAGSRPAPPGDALDDLSDSPVSMSDIVRYQGASGDLNPIHHDDAHARSSGHRAAFSVGMLHAGILGSHVATLFGPENVREFGVRFLEQAWPGDELVYGGSVVERVMSPAGERLARLQLTVSRVTGGVPITGDAVVVEPFGR